MCNVRQEIINAIRFSPVYQTEMATMCSLSVGTIRRIARGEMFTLSDGLLELLDALGYKLVLDKVDKCPICVDCPHNCPLEEVE